MTGGGPFPRSVLRLGILTWTRLHGVLSLELQGGFSVMGVDAGLLYEDEVARVIG